MIDYLDKFEELKALMWNAQPYLTKQYFASNFVNGLRGELWSMVKIMLPTTVRQAAEKAKLQELTLEAIFGRGKPWLRSNVNPPQHMGVNTKGMSVGLALDPLRQITMA